jgi:hypothetical protein
MDLYPQFAAEIELAARDPSNRRKHRAHRALSNIEGVGRKVQK